MRRALLALVAVTAAACSLTNLDGFAGGPAPAADGGNDATPRDAATPSPSGDAGVDSGPELDPYAAAVLADHPSGWWRFDDAPGARVLKDEMGQHDGQVVRAQDGTGVVFGSEGAVGKAADFGGGQGHIDLGDIFDFSGKVELALEAWIKNDAPQVEYEGIFFKRYDPQGDPRDGWLLYIHKPDRSVEFQFWKGGNVTAGVGGPIQKGFHHVVVTSTQQPDGFSFAMYLDGIESDHVDAITVDEPGTNVPITLGGDWNGSLDEMAIYEHALTADRVRAHFDAAKR